MLKVVAEWWIFAIPRPLSAKSSLSHVLDKGKRKKNKADYKAGSRDRVNVNKLTYKTGSTFFRKGLNVGVWGNFFAWECGYVRDNL